MKHIAGDGEVDVGRKGESKMAVDAITGLGRTGSGVGVKLVVGKAVCVVCICSN